MRVDTGKRGKTMGATKPSVARKFDADGLTPGKPLHPITKRYGYTYEFSWWGKRWSKQAVWFRTERGRDQSMTRFVNKMTERCRNVQAISR